MNKRVKTPIFKHLRKNSGGLATSVVLLSLLGLWSVEGGRIIAALNPTLGRELALAAHPALDVWITPPEYAQSAPLIISTPAGVRFDHDTLTLPQGSVLSAHLAEQDGDAPELTIDGDDTTFTTDAHGDFAATMPLMAGKKISIRRGWLTLASWKIRLVSDSAPKVALSEPPRITEGKSVRLSYSASDDFGVDEIALRVTPHATAPGISNAPVDIPLPVPAAKQMTRVDFEDLTAHPWAGQTVTLQMTATNVGGVTSVSAPIDFTLPERAFYHPLARVLIEERRKLLQSPDDEKLRDETANIMAGIAHETANLHGDPVILMALRSGAVRLVLSHDHSAAVSVNDLLWQAATRIEDGSAGTAQRMLRDARQDLAQAIDHNAGREEIQILTDHLEQVMRAYLAHMPSLKKSAHAGNTPTE